jgi:hypothetical protein
MQQNNPMNVWGTPSTVNKVNSLQDLAKLPIQTEVSAKPVQEEAKVEETKPKQKHLTGAAWGTQRAKVAGALAYSKKHPEVTAVEIARQFDIKVQTFYTAKYKAKMKVAKKMASARAAKQQNQPWQQMPLTTGEKQLTEVVRDEEGYRLIQLGGRTARVLRDRVVPEADNVNHPAHYKTGGIETIDFIEAKQLTYNLGNVVKYVSRADHKGNRLEDLEKAAWYLAREIQNLKK